MKITIYAHRQAQHQVRAAGLFLQGLRRHRLRAQILQPFQSVDCDLAVFWGHRDRGALGGHVASGGEYLVMERGYSRIPTYEENVDNIVGVVYAKDLLKVLADGRRPETVREIARPPYFIPEGKHIDELLAELREHKVHMAIVVDEYGGTAGLATIEDVLEEIVGEIQDEYDREEVTIERLTESEAILDARVSLDALNELFDLHIEGEDFDTVGGFVYNLLGRMPNPGDEVHADGLALQVLSVLGRRIKKVRVTKEPVPADGEDGEDQEG